MFPRFTTSQLLDKVTDLLSRLGETPENFTGRVLFYVDVMLGKCSRRLFIRKEVWNWTLVIHWSRFRKKWSSMEENSPQGIWDYIAEKMLWNSRKVDVQFSVQRPHCPGVNSKAKDTESCRYTMQPTRKQLRPFFT